MSCLFLWCNNNNNIFYLHLFKAVFIQRSQSASTLHSGNRHTSTRSEQKLYKTQWTNAKISFSLIHVHSRFLFLWKLFLNSKSLNKQLDSGTPCFCTHGSPAHLTGLHSRHNHHRHTAEGCTGHWCICTHHLYRAHGSGFDLGRQKHRNLRCCRRT